VKSIKILTPASMMPLVADQLAETFTLLKLPAPGPDREKALAEWAPDVRGIAVAGHLACDAAMLARFPKLEIVANFGVGYDSIDAKWAGEHGLIVTNTPDVLTDEVADTCLGLLLMTVRELPQSEQWLRAGHWTGKGPYPLTHNTLRGKKIGIFGLGRIGKAIAKRLEGFGVEIAYHNRSQAKDVSYAYHDTLVGLAKAVDILISVAPGGPDTFHLINADVFKALGPQGTFINIGRGSAVDEPALIKALQDGTIYAAGLDVFEHEPKVPAEFMTLDRVVLLPHVGSASHHTRNLMGQLVVDNLRSWFAGKGPITPVAETPYKK
jgi:lactate dehydrogenase-like 2-hydroxyacid dehydrogenase